MSPRPACLPAFCSVLLSLLAVLSLPVPSRAEVALESLLLEMADPASVAEWPSPEYRCLQSSSYNRESVPPRDSAGWFADSDGTGFIREERRNGRREWVIMEHEGPGCVTKLWTPYFYYDLSNHRGPLIRFYLDGNPEPVLEANFIELVTRGAFPGAGQRRNALDVPEPFARYTARAGDFYLPVPFARGCRITLDAKPFYNIINYRAYPEGTPVRTFSVEDFRRAAGLLEETGAALNAPQVPEGAESAEARWSIEPGSLAEMALPSGERAVRELVFRVDPAAASTSLRSLVLRISFDGEETVWAPLGDFFCCGDALNPFRTRDREARADGTLVSRWVMPYRADARILLQNLGPVPVEISLEARVAGRAWTERSMHFHANWRQGDPVPGTPFQDWNFIDIHGRGVYAGDAWSVLCADTGWWGEGDEKIYVDDEHDGARFPGHFGTGTEDYYGWAGGEVPTGADAFSMPFLSNVRIGNPANPRGYNVCTRTRALDAIPFRERLVFDMEASFGVQMRNPWNLLVYSAVTFWYAFPGATHNRAAQPDRAARPPMTVGELDTLQENIRARR